MHLFSLPGNSIVNDIIHNSVFVCYQGQGDKDQSVGAMYVHIVKVFVQRGIILLVS